MISLEAKGTMLGLAASLGVFGITFGVSPLFQPGNGLETKLGRQAAPASFSATFVLAGEVKQGRLLFERNCAHCHGDDARGDEGPNLHDLAKSDARISRIITGGIKGEMPAFSKKFNDADVRVLIAYLRTLKS